MPSKVFNVWSQFREFIYGIFPFIRGFKCSRDYSGVSASSANSLPSHFIIASSSSDQTISLIVAQKHFSSVCVLNHTDAGHVAHAGSGAGRCVSFSFASEGLVYCGFSMLILMLLFIGKS